MWKSEWKIDRKWFLGKEKWLLLLMGGLLLLILAVPAGWKSTRKPECEVWSEQTGAAEGTGKTSRETGGETAVLGKLSGVSVNGTDSMQNYEKELETRVKEILKYVEGVGTVDVMILLRSSSEKIIHVDQEKSRTSTEEQDSAGGTRKVMTEDIAETALMSGENGNQVPFVEKEMQPEIAGIVISAQGGGSARVKAEISEAMEALFGLPAHKIKVLKRVE